MKGVVTNCNIEVNPVELALRAKVSTALGLFNESLNDWSESDKLDIQVECHKDSMFMARLVFPKTFSGQMSPLHKQIFEIYDGYVSGKLGYNKVLILGPRGFGKSSMGEFFSMHQLLFEETNFLLYLSHSLEGGAELRTESIRMELLTNETARHLFNPIETDEYDSSAVSRAMAFSKKSWVAGGNSFVLPRGMGQQVRGIKWKSYRPNFRMLDDLLDRKECRSSTYRRNSKLWFNQDFLHTDSRYDDNAFTFYIDTKKHPDDIPAMLERWEDWLFVNLGICEPDEEQKSGYKTLVPSFMTQNDLDVEVEKHRTDADLSMTIFAQEFMGISQAEEEKSFLGHIRYYSEQSQEFLSRSSYITTVLIIDPSRSSHWTSNPYGLSVVGIDLEGNSFYFRLAYTKRMNPREFYEEVFSLVKLYNIIHVAVETTGVDEHLTYPLKNEALRSGVYFDLIELHSRKGRPEDIQGDEGPKVMRAYGLLRKCQAGIVYLNGSSCAELETAMMSYPNCSGDEWDVMDSAAYLDQVLDELNMFMYGDTSVEIPLPDEEEYKEFYNEPPLKQDWRIA